MKIPRLAPALGTILVGVFYYWLYVSVVGVAAAVPVSPTLLAPLEGHPSLAVILISLLTTIPAGALAAVVAAILLVKVVPNNQLLWSWIIVVSCTGYAFLRTVSMSDLSVALAWLFPSDVAFLPSLLAWWLFLPLSVYLLSKSSFAVR